MVCLFLALIPNYVEKSFLATMLLGAYFLFLILFSMNGSLETNINAAEASELSPQDSSDFIVGFSRAS
jgi:hypothetical protein